MGDIIENRRLVAASLLLTALALAAAAAAKQVPLFLAASFVIGLGSVAAQVLVPFASYLASESSRGRVVGNVMSGLLLGIMLSRPLSILVADLLAGMPYLFCPAQPFWFWRSYCRRCCLRDGLPRTLPTPRCSDRCGDC